MEVLRIHSLCCCFGLFVFGFRRLGSVFVNSFSLICVRFGSVFICFLLFFWFFLVWCVVIWLFNWLVFLSISFVWFCGGLSPVWWCVGVGV